MDSNYTQKRGKVAISTRQKKDECMRVSVSQRPPLTCEHACMQCAPQFSHTATQATAGAPLPNPSLVFMPALQQEQAGHGEERGGQRSERANSWRQRERRQASPGVSPPRPLGRFLFVQRPSVFCEALPGIDRPLSTTAGAIVLNAHSMDFSPVPPKHTNACQCEGQQ